MNEAQKGDAALSASNYTAAIAHFTTALSSTPESPQYYIKRSTAYQRQHSNAEALRDAERAVVYATKRARRELIGQAQLRRGIALFSLGRYRDAAYVLGLARKIDEKDNSIGIWMKKVEAKLKEEEQGGVRPEVVVKDVPDLDVDESKTAAVTEKAGEAAPAKTIQTPASQIRYEWFQSSSVVTVSIFAKGIPEDKLSVDIQERSLDLSFPLESGSDYQLHLDPLFGEVDVAASSHKLFKTKLDISLRKKVEGVKWAAIEGSPTDASITRTEGSKSSDASTTAVTKAQGPAYPTSSRSGPKDWDKIMKGYTKPKKKHDSGAGTPPSSDSESDSAPIPAKSQATMSKGKGKATDKKPSEGKEKEDIYVDSDSDGGGDEVNGFFKKLFKNADPDTQRAMMKSYQESGGTALSTNWSEVGKGPVAVSPPEGMEERKY